MRLTPVPIALVALTIGASLIVPMPIKGRAGNALLDLGHAPAFGLLTIMAFGATRPRWRGSRLALIALVWVILVGLGGLAEVVQGWTGRHPSLHDAVANALGVTAGLLVATWPSGASRWGRLGRVLAIVGLVAGPSMPALTTLADCTLEPFEMPVLASFESSREMTRWEFQECRATRSRDHVTDSSKSLRLDLGPGIYPGATLAWPVGDWSGYRTLQFDAFLAPGPPLDLVVKIEDESGRGRSERIFRLNPGPNRVRIALAGVRLDFRQVRRLQFFVDGLDRMVTVWLDGVRLE